LILYTLSSYSKAMADRLIDLFFRLLGKKKRKSFGFIPDTLGILWYIADRRHRHIASRNISKAFGCDADSVKNRELTKNVFKNLSRILFEIGDYLCGNERDVFRRIRIRGLSNYICASDKGAGVIVLTSHLGNWELLPHVVNRISSCRTNIVYRPLDFKPLDRFFKTLRSRSGSEMIPTSHAMRKIMKRLKKNEAVGILFDQNVAWYEGVFVDFFGHRACTNKGLALIALKTGAAVVPAFVVREKNGYLAEFQKEVPLYISGDKIRDVEENTRRFNKVLESQIRRYPGQWLWVHQRWKTRPWCLWPRKKKRK
jgi:KDO2-lipid IV(A) lauroyltransferase